MKEHFQYLLSKLERPNNESLKLSMRNVHAKGIFSLVIDGTEFGKLTRVFIADRKLKPFEVQFHTHRYPIKITILNGDITHHIAHLSQEGCRRLKLSEFEYRSVLNGGNGLRYIKETFVVAEDSKLPVGSQIELGINDYHTMSCSKGSIWVVEEKGFEIDYSKVLGVPFVTENLYNEPAQFQIVDKCQTVSRKLKELILQYELLNQNNGKQI